LFPGVQVQIDIKDYVVMLNQGICQVYINTISTESTKVLLGDTFFRNNVVTFDKNNARVGFSTYNTETQAVTIVGND
jgi:hypothetical protein